MNGTYFAEGYYVNTNGTLKHGQAHGDIGETVRWMVYATPGEALSAAITECKADEVDLRRRKRALEKRLKGIRIAILENATKDVVP